MLFQCEKPHSSLQAWAQGSDVIAMSCSLCQAALGTLGTLGIGDCRHRAGSLHSVDSWTFHIATQLWSMIPMGYLSIAKLIVLWHMASPSTIVS